MKTIKATLIYVKNIGNVLLAKKRRKIGAGLWNGYGGKLKKNDTFLKNACDEFEKESGGAILGEKKLEPQALIGFFSYKNFSEVPDFTVLVYTIQHFYVHGDPVKTDEMGDPQWFNRQDIPYNEMLPPDRIFLPRILDGDIFITNFRFNDKKKTSATEFGYREVVRRELPLR